MNLIIVHQGRIISHPELIILMLVQQLCNLEVVCARLCNDDIIKGFLAIRAISCYLVYARHNHAILRPVAVRDEHMIPCIAITICVIIEPNVASGRIRFFQVKYILFGSPEIMISKVVRTYILGHFQRDTSKRLLVSDANAASRHARFVCGKNNRSILF